MSFPRYPEYKDSGVEWLGEVPAHWNVLRLKNVLAQKVTDGPHTTPVFIDEGVPFLSVDGIQNGELVFDGCRFVSEDDHAEFKRKASPRRDDLLMGKAASTGKIARVKVDFDFSIWSPLALIRINRNEALPEFVEYMLKSKATQAEIDNYCTANTQKNISMDDIPRLILTHPPIDEQDAIATFLDRETAKIDTLVAEQEKLIALLQEKRQAVISHAVTKGLDPGVTMKDSGVEWLGEVPGHWEVRRVKDYFQTCSGGTPNTGQQALYYTDEGNGIPWVRTTDLQNDILRNVEVFITEQALKDTACSILPEGTVMVAMYGGDGTVGKNGLLAIAAAINQAVCGLLPANTHSPEYTFRFMQFYRPHWMIGAESSRKDPNISQERVRNAPFLRPPIEEQKHIVTFLNHQLCAFDTLMTEARTAITLLQERRTALISAAVTGQIDVRGLAGGADAPDSVAASAYPASA